MTEGFWTSEWLLSYNETIINVSSKKEDVDKGWKLDPTLNSRLL